MRIIIFAVSWILNWSSRQIQFLFFLYSIYYKQYTKQVSKHPLKWSQLFKLNGNLLVLVLKPQINLLQLGLQIFDDKKRKIPISWFIICSPHIKQFNQLDKTKQQIKKFHFTNIISKICFYLYFVGVFQWHNNNSSTKKKEKRRRLSIFFPILWEIS